jgi:hypothetical protein
VKDRDITIEFTIRGDKIMGFEFYSDVKCSSIQIRDILATALFHVEDDLQAQSLVKQAKNLLK